MARMRIVQSGWENFNGDFGGHIFEASVSLDEIPDGEIVRLGTIVAVERVDMDKQPACPAPDLGPDGASPVVPYPAEKTISAVAGWMKDMDVKTLVSEFKAQELKDMVGDIVAMGYEFSAPKQRKVDLATALIDWRDQIVAGGPESIPEPTAGNLTWADVAGKDAAALLAMGPEALAGMVAMMEAESGEAYQGKRTEADYANTLASYVAGISATEPTLGGLAPDPVPDASPIETGMVE